ncbi:TPA: acyl carrier protein [Burkholderia vietnamiensis]|uniref:acyl carrier protein n=1 Tax=Burkholderia vietnamiensis TaxID=60552 RepID=UPI0015903E2E|nr:acyl carrier protein [Burkholderia vietnamiensis]HDR8947291.1 acyl carrier protein [Burkholderia vietnamiensis]HDR9210043.1 acyl carrier protein [Burkholderia vietnamiensis]
MSEVQATIEQRVKKIIFEQLCINEPVIDNGASLSGDLCADSLDIVEMTMTLEDEFGIEIPDSEMLQLTTVQSVIDYCTANAGRVPA